jgi:hypothetical protein
MTSLSADQPHQLCERLESDFTTKLKSSDMPRYPDSRGVGGAIQAELLEGWDELCKGWGATPEPEPGPKTMYDAAFTLSNVFVGVDFSAKKSAEGGYSDGGICSVADLLRFYIRTTGLFLVAQVRYSQTESNTTADSVRVAPLHALPMANFSIANLGTGQIRLSDPLDETEVDWGRSKETFLREFASIAKQFYADVGAQASRRAESVQAMVDSGFKSISIK